MSVISLFLILLCGYALDAKDADETKQSKRGILKLDAIPNIGIPNSYAYGHGQPFKLPAFNYPHPGGLPYDKAPSILLPAGESDLLKAIPVYITKRVVLEKTVPVPQAVPVPVPVKQPIAVPVYQPYPVPVKQSFPVPVPVPIPVPVNAEPVPIIGPGPVIGPSDPRGYGGGPFPHPALHGQPLPAHIVHGFGAGFGHGHGHGYGQPAFLNAHGHHD